MQFSAILKNAVHRGDLKRRYVVLALLLAVVGLGVLVAFAVRFASHSASAPAELVPPNPVEPLPPSASVGHVFRRGAVCADGAPCAAVGK